MATPDLAPPRRNSFRLKKVSGALLGGSVLALVLLVIGKLNHQLVPTADFIISVVLVATFLVVYTLAYGYGWLRHEIIKATEQFAIAQHNRTRTAASESVQQVVGRINALETITRDALSQVWHLRGEMGDFEESIVNYGDRRATEGAINAFKSMSGDARATGTDGVGFRPADNVRRFPRRKDGPRGD